MNTAYPCLNEYGLAIGETTIGGRRELVNNEGAFMIEELERIALERCKTAREAIKLIGELVKQYGYGDFGECITIADGKEVWHFEIMGAGPLEKGAVWAAVRIPDDHVGISANIRASPSSTSRTPTATWPRTMSSRWPRTWAGGTPERQAVQVLGSLQRPQAVLDPRVLRPEQSGPSLKLTMDMEELPFSVKAEKKLSVRDVLAIYRDPYEGTDLDMTRNLMVARPQPRPKPGQEPARPRPRRR